MVKYNYAKDKSPTFNEPFDAQNKNPSGILPR